MNGLPRFNMPLELGLFLGAKRYGDAEQKKKIVLILDREKYRYQKFISDISGQDIRSHGGAAESLIRQVRDWLSDASQKKTIPGAKSITGRYSHFSRDLPGMCADEDIAIDEITYNNYSYFITEWLRKVSGVYLSR